MDRAWGAGGWRRWLPSERTRSGAPFVVSFRRKPVLASMVAIGGGRPFVVAWRCTRCPAVSGTCICSSRRGVVGEVCWFYVYW